MRCHTNFTKIQRNIYQKKSKDFHTGCLFLRYINPVWYTTYINVYIPPYPLTNGVSSIICIGNRVSMEKQKQHTTLMILYNERLL